MTVHLRAGEVQIVADRASVQHALLQQSNVLLVHSLDLPAEQPAAHRSRCEAQRRGCACDHGDQPGCAREQRVLGAVGRVVHVLLEKGHEEEHARPCPLLQRRLKASEHAAEQPRTYRAVDDRVRVRDGVRVRVGVGSVVRARVRVGAATRTYRVGDDGERHAT